MDQSVAISAWSSAERALAICLVLFAIAIGAIGIQRPVFIDEAYSIILSSYNLSAVFDRLRIDNNFPLYYVFLHFWIRCFGISEIATRVPSVVLYVLGIFSVYKLGEQVSGNSRVALYSAFFYAASLQAVHLAQKVRTYSLMGILAALSTLLLFRCFWKGESRWQHWVFYSVVNMAGSFTHIWFAFLFLAQIVCYLLFFPRSTFRRFFASLLVSAFPFLLLWSGTLLRQMKNGATDWMPAVNFWTAPFAVLEFYGGMKMGAVFLLACGLLLLVRERGELRTPPAVENRAWWALLSMFVVSLGVPLIVSAFKPIYWPGRYTIIALPTLAVLLAWKLAATVWRPAMAAFAGAVLAIVLGLHIAARNDMIENSGVGIHYTDSDKYGSEELMHTVHSGDVLIFTGLSRASVQYYFRRFHREGDVVWINFPAENAEHLGWDNQRIDRASLAAEAGQLSRRLAESGTARPRRILILSSGNRIASDVLLAEISRRFSMIGTLRAHGAFFSSVEIYQNTPRQSPDSN